MLSADPAYPIHLQCVLIARGSVFVNELSLGNITLPFLLLPSPSPFLLHLSFFIPSLPPSIPNPSLPSFRFPAAPPEIQLEGLGSTVSSPWSPSRARGGAAQKMHLVIAVFGYLHLQEKWNFKCDVNAWDFNHQHNKNLCRPVAQ